MYKIMKVCVLYSCFRALSLKDFPRLTIRQSSCLMWKKLKSLIKREQQQLLIINLLCLVINLDREILHSSITPHTEVVISLNGMDDFLKQRVINLPESVVSGTHNNEEG